MEKGHLSIKDLERMKKADLQNLATKLGISSAGTIKELAARIAEIEIDIPEENEFTEEEKAAEQTAKEEREIDVAAEPEKAGRQPEELTNQRKPEVGKARVKAVARYLDKQMNQIKDAGEKFTVSVERATELVAAKVAEIIK